MQRYIKPFLYVFLASQLFLSGCKVPYESQSLQYDNIRVKNKDSVSNKLSVMLEPYAVDVKKKMSDTVAFAAITLEKKSPEGTLGNVLVDAMYNMAKKKYGKNIDGAFVNSGGIRLPVVAKGPITRGKIFEIAPFDNIIVLLEVDGKTLSSFLDIAASKGGWPSAGVTYQIKSGKAFNISIDGKLVEDNKMYTIAVVDYIANGGDNCDMLKPFAQQNKNYLFRDAIIDYFAEQQAAGKQISSTIEKRVTNAE